MYTQVAGKYWRPHVPFNLNQPISISIKHWYKSIIMKLHCIAKVHWRQKSLPMGKKKEMKADANIEG